MVAMTHVVTYIEVQPNSVEHAAILLKEYRATSRVQNGNAGVEILQEISRMNRFVILEWWNDESSFQAHESAEHTKQFRAALAAIHNSPYDQRVHQSFATAEAPSASAGALHVVTHVDVPPPRKDEAERLLRILAGESRNDEGNVRYDVFQQNAPRTNHFTVFAVWADELSFASHTAKSHTRQFREGLGPALGAPYDERLFIRLA